MSIRRSRPLTSLLLCCLISISALLRPLPAQARADNPLQQATLATVQIMIGDLTTEEIISSGSGSLIDQRGFVLTNYHVIEASLLLFEGVVGVLIATSARADEFAIFKGRVVATDVNEDLAVVRIESTLAGETIDNITFPTMPLGDSDQLTTGDEVYVTGYPDNALGNRITTKGIFSGFVKDEGLTWIASDADISSGNSGGSLVNAQGELVAIPTIVMSGQLIGELLSYSRPINVALPLLAEAMNGGDETSDFEVLCEDDFTSNKRGWSLGYATDELAERENLMAKGVLRSIFTFKTDAFGWLTIPDCTAQDFVLFVDVQMLQGEDTNSGVVLLLRVGEERTQAQYYRVLYYLDNTYEVDRYRADEWETIKARTYSPLIKLRSGESNRFAVEIFGSQLTVYANGEAITTVEDGALNGAGEIGLGVVGTADNRVDVAFDNLVVASTQTNVIFADEFDDNHHDWHLGRISTATVNCEDQIVNGRLEHQIFVKKDNQSCYSSAPALAAKDFWLTVDATLVAAIKPGSWLGIAFRADEVSAAEYMLRVSDNNYYTFERYSNDEWHTLQTWTASTAIDLTAGVTNTIQLWVRGPYFTLTINDVELTTIEDKTLSAAGPVTLVVGGEAGVESRFAFDNLRVRQEPPQ